MLNKQRLSFFGATSNTFILIGIVSLAVVFWLASIVVGDGTYEVNIFAAYPKTLWVTLTVVYLAGYGSQLISLFYLKKPYGWIPGFLIVVVANVFVLLIPFLRDYAFASQFDSVVHASRISGILDYLRPTQDNFYPAAHVFASAFTLISGLSVERVVLILPVCFYLFFLVNTLFLAWIVDSRWQIRGLVALWATPLIYGSFSTIFRPTQLAVYALPLLIAWQIKTRQKGNQRLDKIPLLLIAYFLPFVHPVAVIIGVFILIIPSLVSRIDRSRSSANNLSAYWVATLLSILWLSWFGANNLFSWTLRQFVEAIFASDSGRNMFDIYASAASRAGLPLAKILSLVFFKYGAAILYAIPVFIVILDAVKKLLMGKRQPSKYHLMMMTVILFSGIVAIVSIFRDLISYEPLRFFGLIMISAPLFLAYWIWKFAEKKARWTNLFLWSISIVLILSASIGVFSSFESPLNGSANIQYSYPQQAGTAFLREYAVVGEKLIYAPIAGYKYLDSVMNHWNVGYLMLNQPAWTFQWAPPHFGYGSEVPIDEFTVPGPGYLFVTPYERAFYSQVWPEGGKFERIDFETLEDDQTWQKIYASGEMTVWKRRAPLYELGKNNE